MQPDKTTTYSTLIGLINAADYEAGGEVGRTRWTQVCLSVDAALSFVLFYPNCDQHISAFGPLLSQIVTKIFQKLQSELEAARFVDTQICVRTLADLVNASVLLPNACVALFTDLLGILDRPGVSVVCLAHT